MKRILIFLFCIAGWSAFGQKYVAEKSFVSFYSKAAIEDITAENTKSQSLFNTATGEVVFVIPIQQFEFAKSLMKEHFNEKYMDTEKYPKSSFTGKITGYDVHATGEQKATATGKLMIHGVTQDIEVPGTVEFVNGKIVVKSSFIVKLET